eukprot:TRINITY_DN4336_c0_g1_i2.p1 TRINITY_DN4336_c0_g1~~TRINITY_DN4336_c0_g1_i2.p1  ORF type:complete len:141 (-),score=26.96 TRINITY_DN4336_c0_g1_i2:37-459(-)
MPTAATAQNQRETHQLLHKTHQRLDQFELWINAICDRLKIDQAACRSPDPTQGAMVPRGSPSATPTSLSPRSDFTRTLAKTENMNERVRSNLVRVYGRNRQLLMEACLLYTSDAADEEDSVDLGGRRIIKKKKNNTEPVN